jgi:thioredoxin-like negative regulator of GroEL
MAKSAIAQGFAGVWGMLKPILTIMVVLAVGSLIVLVVMHAFGFGKKADSVVLIHSEGCGHCKRMMPAWNKAKAAAKAPHKVVEVEAKDIQHGKVPQVARKAAAHVTSYPTIKAVDKDGNTVKDYDGDRSAESLRTFMDAHTARGPSRRASVH